MVTARLFFKDSRVMFGMQTQNRIIPANIKNNQTGSFQRNLGAIRLRYFITLQTSELLKIMSFIWNQINHFWPGGQIAFFSEIAYVIANVSPLSLLIKHNTTSVLHECNSFWTCASWERNFTWQWNMNFKTVVQIKTYRKTSLGIWTFF